MSWINEINRPEVTLVPQGVSDNLEIPNLATFKVKVTFVGGAYPVLEYETKARSTIAELEQSETELLANLQAKVEAWKAKWNFLRGKQAIIDASLNNIWGVQ